MASYLVSTKLFLFTIFSLIAHQPSINCSLFRYEIKGLKAGGLVWHGQFQWAVLVLVLKVKLPILQSQVLTLCTYKSIDLYVVTEIMESQPKPMAGCGTLVPDKLWN